MILLGLRLENITKYYCFDARSLQRILVQHIFEKGDEILADEIRMLCHLVVKNLAL